MPNNIIAIDDSQDKEIVGNIQSVLASLSSKNNIVEFSNEDFDFNNYEKVDDKFVESLGLADMFSLFSSAIPSAVSSSLNVGSTAKLNKILEDGVFKVVFKEGVSDKTIDNLFKNSQGLLTTTYNDGKGFQQAGLKKLSMNLSINSAANVANGIISIASFALGCYYMTSINNNLIGIKNDIQEMRIDQDKNSFSKLKAIHESLQKSIRGVNSNYYNDCQLFSHIKSACDDQKTAREKVDFYEGKIKDIVRKLECCDKKFYREEKNEQELQRYWKLYCFSSNVYVEAHIVEAIISKNFSQNYLNDKINEINDFVREFNKNTREWNKEIDQNLIKVNWEKPKTFLVKKAKQPISDAFDIAEDAVGALDKIPVVKETSQKLQKRLDDLREKNESQIEKIESLPEKECDKYKERFRLLSDNVLEINNKKFVDYVNRINSIQRDELAICYHNGSMYVEKKYLEMEES